MKLKTMIGCGKFVVEEREASILSLRFTRNRLQTFSGLGGGHQC